jgi:hypothetical protein
MKEELGCGLRWSSLGLSRVLFYNSGNHYSGF